MKFLFCLLIALSLTACGPNVVSQHKLSKVEAVYFHEGDSYSVAVKEGDEIKMYRFGGWNGEAKLKLDVPEGEPMYVEYTKIEFSGGGSRTVATIHIHRVSDLNTAGWNHGKQGRGRTTTIENE